MSIIFVFLDGVGLAPAGPDNPLTDAAMPTLHSLFKGPLTAESVRVSDDLLLAGIDATLGVPGLPQSGTGQTALLAGVNAAAMHGRHQPYFPPVALRSLLAEQNILRQVVSRGRQAAFANAFTPDYWQALAARRIRPTASVIAALGAEARFRTLDDLRAGQALPWDISGTLWRARNGSDVPVVTPVAAGANLARIAREHDLVFYECFLPDLAGHHRISLRVADVLALIDGLLEGVLMAKRSSDTLVITSDHGNIESAVTPTHTRNPVPLLVVGAGATTFATVRDITGVAGAILRVV